ncbi:TIGR03905 family TSCPD domain-containing protein [Ruminococcaceae bacterium OttesenSCG-928-N02]|nr:TIGR03905 family TSCPD domain-containing protein [Ruminococcaceae bacterium OttesenSCG-928-N02]
MIYQRKNQGVCSYATKVTIENGVVQNVEILGGCDGNIKGVISLIQGMPVEEAIARLKGITCGQRTTSCPDQLAIALAEALHQDAAQPSRVVLA